MSKQVYIYSTLTASTAYPSYINPENGIPRAAPGKTVVIKGGANVADKHVVTPRGVVTILTEEQYNSIKDHRVFKKHVEGGFIKVENRKADPETVAADMTGRDQSAPLVPEDFNEDDKAKPEVKSTKKK